MTRRRHRDHVWGRCAAILALLASFQFSGAMSASQGRQPEAVSDGPAPLPPGIVSWWRGDGNATDSIGTNNGSAMNGAAFATGLVGHECHSIERPRRDLRSREHR